METETETKTDSPFVPLMTERSAVFENYMEADNVCITCIYGPFRSGKSTLVQDLIETVPNLIVLDEDMLKAFGIGSNGNNDFIACTARLALYYAYQGHNVVVDAIQADKVYEYLNDALTALAGRKSKVIGNKRRSKGAEIIIRKTSVDEVKTFAR